MHLQQQEALLLRDLLITGTQLLAFILINGDCCMLYTVALLEIF